MTETTDEAEAELFEVEPREQFGARTGALYDYQYHQAAADALQLLDDSQVACVYCEWHDDYVLEATGVVSYQFHQVKTRVASKGPWKVSDFFGVPRRKKAGAELNVDTTSIFARFWDHVTKFTGRCGLFVFVTDNGLAGDFDELLLEVHSCVGLEDLKDDARKEFDRLSVSLKPTFPSLTDDGFFNFLTKLRVRPAVGTVGNIQDCRMLIGGRILHQSEVNLTVADAQKIGAELVAAVRDRSHRVLTTLPESSQALRAAKGLVIDDVLSVLSLSTSGYRELKAGGREAVVALSRLQRLLARSGLPPSEVPLWCRLKASWDAWWITQRHVLRDIDMIALRTDCVAVLTMHTQGNLDVNGLRREAARLAHTHRDALTATEPLTDELVFGLMLSMSVEADR